jgi:hypothetical protein
MAQDLLHGGKKTKHISELILDFPSMDPKRVAERDDLRKKNMESEWDSIHKREAASEDERLTQLREFERIGDQGGISRLQKGWGYGIHESSSFREIEKREKLDKEKYDEAGRKNPNPNDNTPYDGGDI